MWRQDMPGYAGWKQIYKDEYEQLIEEGFAVSGVPMPEEGEGELFPFPEQAAAKVTAAEEAFWKTSYQKLWASAKKNGIRADYVYQEPEALEEILKRGGTESGLYPLQEKEYRKRLEGAVYGKCAAVVLGKPLEMGFDRIKVREYLESVGQYPLKDYIIGYSDKLQMELRKDCLPSTAGHVAYVQPDDDIHYLILAVLLAEKYGFTFTGSDIGRLWLENIPYHWLWCSSRQAYYHLVNLEETNQTEKIKGIPKDMNPWRECIDGQIRSDLWGYLSPGRPRRAAELAYQDCSFSLAKNGVYGGMFTAGCIAAAFSGQPDVQKILEGGLSVIPEESRLADAVHKVMKWYQEAQGDWIVVCDMIYAAYGHLPFAAAVNNLAVVTLALLHGNLDYTKSITTAVMCGIDTDCNAGTVGSIVGAATGIDRIDKRWITPLQDTIYSAVASFGRGSITELTDRIEKLYSKFSSEPDVQA